MARPRSNTERENTKSRIFQCVLYPDSEDYNFYNVLDNIRSNSVQYILAVHDKDRYTAVDMENYLEEHNGESPKWQINDQKKIHYHVISIFENTKTLGLVSRLFCIPSNYVQKVGNKTGAIQYLLHKNNPEKFQYLEDVIETNIPNWKKRFFDVDNEMKADSIIEEILWRSSEGKYVSITSMAQWCIYNNCWDEFRRGQHLFMSIITECNTKLSKEI